MSDDLMVVFRNSDDAILLEIGGLGPPGPPGPAGGATTTLIASGAIGGHRVVKITAGNHAVYADNTDVASRGLSVGVTTDAAVSGGNIDVLTVGYMTDVSFAWTPLGMLYLGVSGLLTQVPPSYPAFLRVIGFAISATEVWIDPQPSIVRSP